ncbi:(d)CMP kinase [Clostridium folliculivorans]|uniref:Cytidylate kinase n=1 Tax=Clostridium folliculivorans TaxID=2886038 RepID=A0A9W6DAD1_9CLOT|nr:(d)CMP kinase [Clostridium folliculivorans]GKU24707.1 cytidylate kinase [Clostridium folliculivorans]GKU30805.1 cytidylate kinase [Clostridium folliculivorans]
MRLSVAIDGPAGAGKSTIAKIVAKRYNLMYINTGSMYRAVTYKALEKDIPPENIEALCNLIETMEMHFENDELYLNGVNINDQLTIPNISKNVSAYASIKEVRTRLVTLQRDMSKKYDVIMDGRDIGTVVLKDASFKFFLTASPEERATRRYEELKAKGLEVDYSNILKDIIQRDYLDSNREVDPLSKADDALEVDTTGINIDQVVSKICEYINNGLELSMR